MQSDATPYRTTRQARGRSRFVLIRRDSKRREEVEIDLVRASEQFIAADGELRRALDRYHAARGPAERRR